MLQQVAHACQPLGAILALFGIFLFAWDHNNDAPMYILPIGMVMLGVGEAFR